jgi:hypothetical protein
MANTITRSENALKNFNENMNIIARSYSGRRVRHSDKRGEIYRVPKACSVSKTFIYIVYISVLNCQTMHHCFVQYMYIKYVDFVHLTVIKIQFI